MQAQMTANHDPKMIGLWKVGRTLGRGFSGKKNTLTFSFII
jgi:hypothetical protein